MECFLKESSHYGSEEEVFFKLDEGKNEEEPPAEISNQMWEKLIKFSNYIEASITLNPDQEKDSFAEQ